MFKNYLLLNLFVFCSLASFGQYREYTYISDRVFATSDDFLGCTFRPNEMQMPDDDRPRGIGVGNISFRITLGYLWVKENEEETAFNMTTINPTEYGFKMDLMNANKPSEQGHLKVFLNDKKQVDAFAYKRHRQAPEIVYYQATLSKNTQERDQRYFTDIKDMNLANIQFAFGKSVKPFYRTDREKTRIYPGDSLSFKFSEKEVTVGKKTKKEQFVTFRFLERTETDENIKEMEFVVKKISDITYEYKGEKAKAWELELEKFPGKTLTLYCTPSMFLRAMQFGESIFYLRDEKLHNAPEKK